MWSDNFRIVLPTLVELQIIRNSHRFFFCVISWRKKKQRWTFTVDLYWLKQRTQDILRYYIVVLLTHKLTAVIHNHCGADFYHRRRQTCFPIGNTSYSSTTSGCRVIIIHNRLMSHLIYVHKISAIIHDILERANHK